MRCPDWFPVIRTAKWAGIPVTEALGLRWCIVVENWCQIAAAAENGAEEYFRKQAERKNRG